MEIDRKTTAAIYLRRNAGVVVTGYTANMRLALHSVPAQETIVDTGGQCMAQVKSACHVGRWKEHDERRWLVAPIGTGRGQVGVRRRVGKHGCPFRFEQGRLMSFG